MVKLDAISMLLHSTFWCEIKVFKTKAVVGGSGDKRLSFITRLANDPTDGERHDHARVFHSVPNKTRVGKKRSRRPINSHQRLSETAISWLSLF